MPDKTQPDLALDALVAEHVLGWTNVHIALYNVRGVPPGYADKQPPDRTVNFPGLGWSTVISSAWAVVEAMRAKGYLLALTGGDLAQPGRPGSAEDLEGVRWIAEFWAGPSFKRAIASASSAPHAICLAALKALEVADA